MPYKLSPTGEKIYADIIVNFLGVINRCNPYQLFEMSINNLGNKVADKIHFECKTMKEKEDTLFAFYDILHEDEGKELRKFYKTLSKARKEEFFENVYKEKTYIQMPIMWENEPVFLKILKAYKHFGFSMTDDTYVYKESWGRHIKMMRPCLMSEMYIIKLKQTSKKSFSVRSIGSIGIRNVPEKSNKAKIHQEQYAGTPIRIGTQEMSNMCIGVEPQVIADLFRIYRSSPFARRRMATNLMRYKNLDDFEVTESDKNVNVQMLKAYLKAMGVGIEYSDEGVHVKTYGPEYKLHEEEEEGMIMCNEVEWETHKVEKQIRQWYKEKGVFIGAEDEYDKLVKNETQRIIAKYY